MFVVELRHTTGCLFNENREVLDIYNEIEIIESIAAEVRKEYPYFRLMLILTCYKIVGPKHAKQILGHIHKANAKFPHLIAGFDMVNEEEYTPQICEFAPLILGAKEHKGMHNMPCFFHAGETHDMSVTNLHDAVCLNAKRVGHGFQLSLFPNLIQEVIKRDICVEVCPLSNMVLGYTIDLRMHPCRFLLNQGVQASISSDDPGFFNYKGVTLDYTYVTLAWELDIADLKRLSLNGIKYASIDELAKAELYAVFDAKWAKWAEMVSKIKIEAASPDKCESPSTYLEKK